MNTVSASQIRAAEPKDYEGICELFHQLDALHVAMLPHCFQPFEGPARPVEIFNQKLADENKAPFVALSGTRVIGFVDVQKESSPPYPMFRPRDYALIDNLFVVPESRGTGLAHELMERAKPWARERGFTSLQLKVYNANEGAVKFYQKEGMRALNTTFEVDL